MPPYTYRLRFLILRDRLPHTAEDEPHVIEGGPAGPMELHLRPGTGNRPDNLILIRRGVPSADQAIEEALAAKHALMRAGLMSYVPMLFGNNTSGNGLAPALIEHMRQTTGVTPRPDMHGIDIIDEAEGPTAPLRIEGEGHVGVSVDMFIGELSDSLTAFGHQPALDERMELAIEVFMAASTERTPRARFLELVTVLEILAERQPNSPEAVAIMNAALVQLDERQHKLDNSEVRSLRGSLGRLKNRSISHSVRDLADGLDQNAIEGYTAGDIREFLRHCYEFRSKLVHNGREPAGDITQLAGNLEFLLRQMLILRIDDGSSSD